jgi:hypothetical protein
MHNYVNYRGPLIATGDHWWRTQDVRGGDHLWQHRWSCGTTCVGDQLITRNSAGSLTIDLILCRAAVVWWMSLEQASHSGAEPPTPNTASTVNTHTAQNSQQPPPAREGDKTERIWSSEEFTELRLTLAALWALQGGLPWHTLHTDNTHGAFRVEHEYSILLVYSGY